MKIAFLIGSLARGKDGVGDFAATLAGRCTSLGHPCAFLAINDRHATGTAPVETTREEEGHALPLLSLPETMPWAERVRRAVRFREAFAPDWISLQFVPYSFQRKGLPFGFAGRVQAIAGRVPVHVMTHELWVSGQRSEPWRRRLLSRLQATLVRQVLHQVEPRVIHATLPVLVETLQQSGFHASLLPLFGSIPVASLEGSEALDQQLRGTSPGNARPWCGGFFGSFYPEWQPEPLFSMLQEAARRAGRPLHLASAGRLTSFSETLWEKLARTYPGIRFIRLGEQPPGIISQYFQLLDFGLAGAPWNLLGKSSSAAAMRDHGLPVIVTAHPQAGFTAPGGAPLTHAELIFRCDATLPAQLAAGLPRRAPSESLQLVAEQFLSSLANAATEPGMRSLHSR